MEATIIYFVICVAPVMIASYLLGKITTRREEEQKRNLNVVGYRESAKPSEKPSELPSADVEIVRAAPADWQFEKVNGIFIARKGKEEYISRTGIVWLDAKNGDDIDHIISSKLERLMKFQGMQKDLGRK